MFERYTERARRVLFFARFEASQLGSIAIESEHFLLGLIREGKGLTSRLFARHHLNLAEIRSKIEARTVFHERLSTSVEIPFTTDTKKILQHAADEADRLTHNYIGTEHLLLGILRQEQSTAATILMEKGFRLQDVRDEIAQLLSEKTALAPSEPSSTASIAQPWPQMMIGGQPIGFPDLPSYLPSNALHISYSRRHARSVQESAGPRHWIMAAVELKAVIARAYGIDEGHLTLPVALVDGQRFDVVLVLPKDESAETIAHIVQRAIEEQFAISVTRLPGPAGEFVVVTTNS